MRWRIISLLLAGIASPALTQIGLPQPGSVVGSVVGGIDRTVDHAIERAQDLDVAEVATSIAQLARARVQRLASLVRANPERIELDELGQPARRGIILLLDADAASLATARRLGFSAQPVEVLDALGLSAAELTVPQGLSLSRGLKQLRKVLPDKTLTADTLHFESASATLAGNSGGIGGEAITAPVGLIDGGVAPVVAVVERHGFATGAPTPSDHGTAVASLLSDAGVRNIFAADVYGRDPAGGGALAITRALGWLVGRKTSVVSISLVGPRNALLERAIAASIARGTVIVAAVGNDGPSAPPAYPASYPGVLAVTGVDGRGRALIEAGRALHLDYAAPGADIKAPNARGEDRPVRGTSYAAPLVAARAAAAIARGKPVRPTLDAEARDLGKKGPDKSFGRGLLCGSCARR